MLRRTTALAVTTLTTAALLAAPPVIAAAETCQGLPATIVGTGTEIKGTPGDDVIVTGASRSVWAGDGNDLVCVTPSLPASQEKVTVWAEAGQDVVDTTASTSATWTDLGTGHDRFVGGPGDDDVEAYDAYDDVSSGDGRDSVELWLNGPVDTSAVVGRYDGGGGSNTIRAESQTLDVELRLDETLIVGGVLAGAVANFDSAIAYAPHVVLRGNAGANYLRYWGCGVEVRGEGGDDYISARYIDDDRPRFDQCLRSGEARVHGGQGADVIDAMAGPDRLMGDAGHDVLVGAGGHDVLVGGAGRDRLDGVGGNDVLRGNRADDRLLGGRGNDTLLGGPGRDRADGQTGRDRCVAEVERHCER